MAYHKEGGINKKRKRYLKKRLEKLQNDKNLKRDITKRRKAKGRETEEYD